MPRGYELDKYYDAIRAVNRKIFSTQIKILSGILDKIGYRHADSYKLIISSINNGLYDNLGDLYQRTHFGNNANNFIGLNKSSSEQDFMSPMELRMCAMAVRRACKQLESLRGRFDLKNVQDICYSAGSEVASEIGYLSQGKEEFGLKMQEPVLSTKPILKKYNHSIIMGTLPKSKKFTYDTPEKKQEKKDLIYKNNQLFQQVKSRLIELGLNSVGLRQRAFGTFNTSFYEMDLGNTHTLEISKIIITDKAEDYISIDELKINCDKLQIMKNSLDRLEVGLPFNNVFKLLDKAGNNARHTLIQKYKTLPELYSGFYHTFIDADKKYVFNKTVKEENNHKTK